MPRSSDPGELKNMVVSGQLKVSSDGGEVMLEKKLFDKYHKSTAVVTIESSAGSRFKVVKGGGWRLIKLFIRNCEDCHFELDHLLITQHVEIIHCSNITLHVRAPIATVQLDLCDGVKVKYEHDVTKIYHAGVKSMEVEHKEHSHQADYTDLVIPSHVIAEEQQFVTRLVKDKIETAATSREEKFKAPEV